MGRQCIYYDRQVATVKQTNVKRNGICTSVKIPAITTPFNVGSSVDIYNHAISYDIQLADSLGDSLRHCPALRYVYNLQGNENSTVNLKRKKIKGVIKGVYCCIKCSHSKMSQLHLCVRHKLCSKRCCSSRSLFL